jgi:hypothetical protein
MTHVPLAATVAPQVLVCENELELVPVIEIPLRVSVPVPVFLSVIFCAVADVPTDVLAKVRLAGLRLTAGAVPVPVRVTVCGDPVALSATLTLAVNVPVDAGWKVTVIVQDPLAATLDPQVFCCE